MHDIREFDFDLPKKMHALNIWREKGETEALRLYPEYTGFIISCRGKDYEQAKEDLFKAYKKLR